MNTTNLPLVVCLSFVASALVAQTEVPTGKPVEKPAAERRMGLAKPVTIDAEKEIYGAALSGKPVATLVEITKDPKSFEGKTVQIRGKITNVCVKKGCWMGVKDGEKDITVRFTGYKFFVPFDVAGRDVAAEGIVKTRVVTEAERKHYAEDAGKSKEEIAKIVGDETIVDFTADAVHIGKLPELPKKACSCCGTDGEKKAEGGCCNEAEKKGGCCEGEGKGAEPKPTPEKKG